MASRGLNQLPILLNAISPIYLMKSWAFLLINCNFRADIKTAAGSSSTLEEDPECAAVNGHGLISVFELVMQPFLVVLCFEPWACAFS